MPDSINLTQKQYIVLVQCHIVKERCPGYLCEKAFHERTGGFSQYPKDRAYRMLSMTCGGCCGRAVHRKLTQFLRTIAKKEGITKEQVVVQLSSCITNDNYHAPPCPHLDYIRTLIARIGLDVRDASVVSATAEKRRREGRYHS
ncbi:MAG: CGGC domain-containing protein [Sedimentisphaerales bacterium]|jgi:predicted metal-binding protein|nr:CGGC domain-containing protein [Sedimentisphaerales bacterium]NLT78095.1 CGGC domain-containing protein [Planctomycetota bacterium]